MYPAKARRQFLRTRGVRAILSLPPQPSPELCSFLVDATVLHASIPRLSEWGDYPRLYFDTIPADGSKGPMRKDTRGHGIGTNQLRTSP